ncbi:hypothetical protein HHK36_018064 [Tetracentron sinense]|uniref:FAE domain-containing protein n=1 Tax=Tetracentron sinense TaxID=13715 RepID=A0A834YYY4_TETSI|nr:hypothetical protein HHK36_018064 [Tetracentron sinense]
MLTMIPGVVHGLPSKYLLQEAGAAIAGRIRDLIEVDLPDGGGARGKFLRIKVQFDIGQDSSTAVSEVVAVPAVILGDLDPYLDQSRGGNDETMFDSDMQRSPRIHVTSDGKRVASPIPKRHFIVSGSDLGAMTSHTDQVKTKEGLEEVIANVQRKVTDQMNVALCKPVTMEEVKFQRQNSSSNFDDAAIQFQHRVLKNSGIGDETYLPRSVFLPGRHKVTLKDGREEAAMVMFGAVDDLLATTGVRLNDIKILIVNCSILNTTPSLSAMLINHYKLRHEGVSLVHMMAEKHR